MPGTARAALRFPHSPVAITEPRRLSACMLQAIEQLLILQDRDRKLRTLRLEHKNAPLEKQAFADKVTAAQKQLDVARQKAKEFELERKKLETEAQSVRDKIAKYQVQK